MIGSELCIIDAVLYLGLIISKSTLRKLFKLLIAHLIIQRRLIGMNIHSIFISSQRQMQQLVRQKVYQTEMRNSNIATFPTQLLPWQLEIVLIWTMKSISWSSMQCMTLEVNL